jgi:hypothetical protein
LFFEELKENLIIRSPTFNIENWRLNKQFFFLNLLWSFRERSSKGQWDANKKCFNLGFQLLAPKVGDQARKSCAWPLMEPRGTKLGNSMRCQTKNFASTSHGTLEEVA